MNKTKIEQPMLLPAPPTCGRCEERAATWRVRYEVIGLCLDPNQWRPLCDQCKAEIERFFGKVREEERLDA